MNDTTTDLDQTENVTSSSEVSEVTDEGVELRRTRKLHQGWRRFGCRHSREIPLIEPRHRYTFRRRKLFEAIQVISRNSVE
jgi:hypothetical protein